VETQAQRNVVSAVGCESAQGFFFSRPVSAAEFSYQLNAMSTGQLQLPVDRNAMAAAP
jgi:EAL domain-containing protein (putative c-di-GMP-specific phosphodiesterase class I)